MDLRVTRREDHLKVGDGRVPHADVIGDGVLKQHDLLVHHGDGAREHIARNLRNGPAVEEDLPLPRLIQAGDQLADRRFSTAACPDDGHPATRLQVHGEVGDDGAPQPGIAEGDVLQFHLAPELSGVLRRLVRAESQRGILGVLHHVLHALHLGAHLLDGLARADQRHGRVHEG